MPDLTPPAAHTADVAALDAAVDEAIASCDGDARAAVRALLITLDVYEAELEALRDDVSRIRAAVSPGYLRGHFGKGHRDGEGQP